VVGSDVGFSALEEDLGPVAVAPGIEDLEDDFDLDSGTSTSDLPFVNIELDGDVIRYGFFPDEKAAAASDPDAAGEFSETEAYAAGEEAVSGEFEYLGAVDLAPILDEYARGSDSADALGGSPEDLAAPFLAERLGVVAFGQRTEDETAITRYVLRLAD
jgi:hypothetical protein